MSEVEKAVESERERCLTIIWRRRLSFIENFGGEGPSGLVSGLALDTMREIEQSIMRGDEE